MNEPVRHTPAPWKLGEFDDCGGYDCIYAGITAGPVTLDGGDYGQHACQVMDLKARACMEADARLIAAAPELLDALEVMIDTFKSEVGVIAEIALKQAREAVKHAREGGL